MKIAVIGLWHLGCVTAACLAKAGHDVLAYDADEKTIQQLQQGKSPIFEPGLDELLMQAQQAKTLRFSHHLADLSQADIIWVTYDTPVDENDVADVHFVTDEIKKIIPYLKNDALILISSQLPVGTTRQLIAYAEENSIDKNITFSYSPENLRLGKAIAIFTKPDRIVVGVQKEADKKRLIELLKPFPTEIIWMSIESAEMTKHAINAFLATSVVFINEFATLCERVGVDAREVERGLKTEERIGPKAYVRPGNAIAGGTLLRDVHFLIEAGHQKQVATPFLSALLACNQAHKQWSCQRLMHVMKNLQDKTIVTLGLTYKAGTDTLRRSTAIETCEWLNQQGAKVVAYDPAITQLSKTLSRQIELKSTLDEALHQADALIITTEWPEFTALTADQLLKTMKEPIVFDASGFLFQKLGSDHRIRYYAVGRST